MLLKWAAQYHPSGLGRVAERDGDGGSAFGTVASESGNLCNAGDLQKELAFVLAKSCKSSRNTALWIFSDKEPERGLGAATLRCTPETVTHWPGPARHGGSCQSCGRGHYPGGGDLEHGAIVGVAASGSGAVKVASLPWSRMVFTASSAVFRASNVRIFASSSWIVPRAQRCRIARSRR